MSEIFSQRAESRLLIAIGANGLLTVVQVGSGFWAGSLSLMADALHNFGDAAALVIALVAMRLALRPADPDKTFGYRRAESIGALINLTVLIMLSLYLVVEAVERLVNPREVTGALVMAVAALALVIDTLTVLLTAPHRGTNQNMRAAFLHNMADALASVGVILAGAMIWLYEWFWADAAVTLLIAGYIMWHGVRDIWDVIHLLMEGTPQHLKIGPIKADMEKIPGVRNVHHLHLWNLDENRLALEAHVLIETGYDMEELKTRIKDYLINDCGIGHSTLEFEYELCAEERSKTAFGSGYCL